MKEKKVRQLLEEFHRLDSLHHIPAPVTFDNLEVDFEARTVTFRGRKVEVRQRVVVFPMLGSDRMILLKGPGEVV